MLTDPARSALVDAANAVPAFHHDSVAEVYHFSEDGTIRRFAPHVPPTNPSHPAAVWAIDADHAPLYWFPRDCPRISVWARGDEQRAVMAERFGSESARICAFETGWLDRVRATRLFRYTFDAAGFRPWELADGQYVADEVVQPEAVDELGDLLVMHAERDVEVRVTPRLGPLLDQVLTSGLPFSCVRLRNARV